MNKFKYEYLIKLDMAFNEFIKITKKKFYISCALSLILILLQNFIPSIQDFMYNLVDVIFKVEVVVINVYLLALNLVLFVIYFCIIYLVYSTTECLLCNKKKNKIHKNKKQFWDKS